MDDTLVRMPRDELNLAELWHALLTGSCFVTDTTYRAGRCFATLYSTTRRGLALAHAAELERVLSGEMQKVVAQELGVSVPTLSLRCTRALRAMAAELHVSRASILLVMAALAARGWPLPRACVEEHASGSTLVSVAVPGRELSTLLTACEADVLRLTIEGKSYSEVAAVRRTCQRTVANQLGAVFRKLGVSGRAALRARAVEEYSRGWDCGGLPVMPQRQAATTPPALA